jgi:YD repeat-containing protein
VDRWVSYFLDNAGNRTLLVDTGVHKSYAPNKFNQYTEAEGVSVGNGIEHEVRDYQGNHYTYRNDERLISVTGPATYDLAYDALGRCVKRTLTGVGTTYYIYDGEKPILFITRPLKSAIFHRRAFCWLSVTFAGGMRPHDHDS